MKKTVFTIFILLILIGVVAYYGYTTIFVKGVLSEQSVEKILADVDANTADIDSNGISDETLTSLDAENATIILATPASLADLDAAIAELNSFAGADTSGFTTTLSDL
ncbi:MAG: hypothetical protein RI996_122 [Candidatus Parcubacteria bacterium]|jgi:hypothetical protein